MLLKKKEDVDELGEIYKEEDGWYAHPWKSMSGPSGPFETAEDAYNCLIRLCNVIHSED